MPRVAKTNSAAQPHPYGETTQTRGGKKNPKPLEAATAAELKEIGAASREEFGKSKCTRLQYERYIQRGKEFLAECVKQRRSESQGETDSGLDNDLLARAFDGLPNKTSVDALEFFLVQKCLREGCTHSTAASIVAAFASHWDGM